MEEKLKKLKKELEEHYKKHIDIFSKDNYLRNEIKNLEKMINKQKKERETKSNLIIGVALFILTVITFMFFQ